MALSIKTTNFIVYLITVTLLLQIKQTTCDLFTALAHMERMITVEDVLLTNLKNYVSTQRQILDFLKKYVEYEQKQLDANIGDVNFFLNPLNAFSTISKVTKGYDTIEIAMKSGNAESTIANITKYRTLYEFPTETDLKGTALALLRIQKVYDISIKSIANGDYHDNQKYRYNMTSEDCFLLAKYYTEIPAVDYREAMPWLLEALSRLPIENSLNRIEIFRKLIDSAQRQNNLIDELYFTNQLLKLITDDNELIDRKEKLIEEIKKLPPKTIIEPGQTEKSELVLPKVGYDYYDSKQKEQYEKLCRKEIVPSAKQLAPLRCRYITNNSPFLKIAPLKVEELHLDPDVYLFHDVIYDKEIDILKDISMHLMETAKVLNVDNGKLEPSHMRTSKSVFIRDEVHKYIKVISDRVEDMTGLKITSAEALQVVNYGIGGHYDPHVDYFPDSYKNKYGNRIATVLFYLSDVLKGGGTAFPFLNTVVWPEKGTAAVWYNLKKSGVGDLRTKHAGCPVLAGTKWVANKWLHIADQEFSRPCGLSQDE